MFSLWRSHRFVAFQYLRYWLQAVDQYSLHTAFVFRFYNEVILDNRKYYAFDEIEKLRSKWLKDHSEIAIKDLGSGSMVDNGSHRKISSIATHSLSSQKFSRFLFSAVLFFRPQIILELGTSLGITTLYLAKANTNVPVITLEGCPETAKIAQTNFSQLNAENITLKQGNIHETLPETLATLPFVDFIYFDANHTKAATLHYFDLCLAKIRDQTLFVFDDIHSSPEMFEAWKVLSHHPSVTISIDIFDAGLLLFDKGLNACHYTLQF